MVWLDFLSITVGLSSAAAICKTFPAAKHRNVVVICGPGSTTIWFSDILMSDRCAQITAAMDWSARDICTCLATRLLSTIQSELTAQSSRCDWDTLFCYTSYFWLFFIWFKSLVTQMHAFKIPLIDQLPDSIADHYQLIVDAIFGYSFKGDIRPPFDAILKARNKYSFFVHDRSALLCIRESTRAEYRSQVSTFRQGGISRMETLPALEWMPRCLFLSLRQSFVPKIFEEFIGWEEDSFRSKTAALLVSFLSDLILLLEPFMTSISWIFLPIPMMHRLFFLARAKRTQSCNNRRKKKKKKKK